MTEKSTVPEQEDSNKAPVEETTDEQTEETEGEEAEEPAEPAKTEPEAKAEEVEVEKKERPVYNMPVHKHVEETKTLKEKHAAREAELQAEIETLKKQPANTSTAQVDEDINAVATKYNLAPEALADIIGLATKKAGAPNREVAELLQQTKIKQLQEEVRSDFDSKVLPLIQKDYPDATPEFIAQIKNQISEKAFSQGYNTLPVEDIYFISKGKGEVDFKNNYTAEPTGGKRSEHKNFANMSEKQALQLPPREYKIWSDQQAKKQQSQYVD